MNGVMIEALSDKLEVLISIKDRQAGCVVLKTAHA